MAALSGKILIIIGAVLALIGFAVALGGVGKLNDVCDDFVSSAACSRGLQYPWWGIWFNFALAILALVFAFLGWAGTNATMQSFLAACLSVTMLVSREFIDFAANDGAAPSEIRSANDAATAGFIIMSVADFVLIIALGMNGSFNMNIAISKGSGSSASKVTPAKPKEENKSAESA